MRVFGGMSTFGRQSVACTCFSHFCPHGLHHALPLKLRPNACQVTSSIGTARSFAAEAGEMVRVPGLVMAKGATKSTCFAPFLASASESQPAGWRVFLKPWTPGSEPSREHEIGLQRTVLLPRRIRAHDLLVLPLFVQIDHIPSSTFRGNTHLQARTSGSEPSGSTRSVYSVQ